MRAVTAATVHFAFEERMRERLQGLAALYLMAVVADFGLCRGLHNCVTRCMADVAVGACDFIVIVRSAVPAETHVGIVAIEAYIVLNADFGRFV